MFRGSCIRNPIRFERDRKAFNPKGQLMTTQKLELIVEEDTNSVSMIRPKGDSVIPRPDIQRRTKPRTYIFVSSYWKVSQRFICSSDNAAKIYVQQRYSDCPGKSALYRIEEIPWKKQT